MLLTTLLALTISVTASAQPFEPVYALTSTCAFWQGDTFADFNELIILRRCSEDQKGNAVYSYACDDGAAFSLGAQGLLNLKGNFTVRTSRGSPTALLSPAEISFSNGIELLNNVSFNSDRGTGLTIRTGKSFGIEGDFADGGFGCVFTPGI